MIVVLKHLIRQQGILEIPYLPYREGLPAGSALEAWPSAVNPGSHRHTANTANTANHRGANAPGKDSSLSPP